MFSQFTKAIPKVVVPTDFGIEKLECEFHGNVILKLAGEETMRANSVILSFHSSVFVHLFSELKQSTLVLDEFLPGAVKSFIAALYCGKVELNNDIFRDVNKISHSFKVSWLISSCSDFFKNLVDLVTHSSEYSSVLFIFEEARFTLSSLKSNAFLHMVVHKLVSLENCTDLFVGPYMKINEVLSTAQLDLMIRVTQNVPVSLLKNIKKNVEDNAFELNGNSLYLIENLDLFKCVSQDSALYEDLFDLILEKTQNLTIDETKRVNKIYRSNTRKYYDAIKLKVTGITPAESGLLKTNDVSGVPSMFRTPPAPQTSASSFSSTAGAESSNTRKDDAKGGLFNHLNKNQFTFGSPSSFRSSHRFPTI